MEMKKKKDLHKLNEKERFRNWKMVSSFCVDREEMSQEIVRDFPFKV